MKTSRRQLLQFPVMWVGTRILKAQQNPRDQLAAFLDGYLAGEQSDRPADLSRAYFADQLQKTRSALNKLRTIDSSKLSVNDRIDFRFAESALVGQELSQERMQYWKKDPRVYMPFRRITMLIDRPGDASGKVPNILAAVQMVPAQLENGRHNLNVSVPRFRDLGLFMAEGAIDIFRLHIPTFASSLTTAQKAELLKANAGAERALNSYIAFLKTDLPKLPVATFAIGKETYDAMLRGQYLLAYDSDSLYAFGRSQFADTVKELEGVAKKIDRSKTWQQLAVEIKNDYPDPAKEIQVHQEWVDKARAHILSKHLIPIPWNERVDVVPRAEYLRKTSYYGNFSSAKAPNKDGVLVGQWQINPFDPAWDEKTKKEYVVEHDWGVIIVTAPHETYGGHHVQGLYQLHNPSKLRRTHGISIFSEGWGLYNEQLMFETGFFPNERIHLRQLQLRLWRIARVIWDVGIHTGKMSYDEAVSLLSDQVGFLRWAAELEVDGSAEAPGYRIGYFMGYSEIMKMRDEFRKNIGARFSLADFHERLLKVGNMPPALMRDGLMASIEA